MDIRTIFSVYILPLFDVMLEWHHIKENNMQVSLEKEGEEGCPLMKIVQKVKIWAIFVKRSKERKREEAK